MAEFKTYHSTRRWEQGDLPYSIEVDGALYDLSRMSELKQGDVFYIKERGVPTVEGPYTYTEGVRETEGELLWRCVIKTKCDRRFEYSHNMHVVKGYKYHFYKYVPGSDIVGKSVIILGPMDLKTMRPTRTTVRVEEFNNVTSQHRVRNANGDPSWHDFRKEEWSLVTKTN